VPSGQDALSELGEKALAYARFGWPVFPIRPQMKVPATPHGVLDAKKDESAIRRAWSQYPDLNIGLACGSPSGVYVLDVDDRHGGLETLAELETKYGALPRTLSIVTPNGGTHYYFKRPVGGEWPNTAGTLGPGLDTRGDGGYVLAPPSVVNGRTYEVDERADLALLPMWMVQRLTRARLETRRAARNWAQEITEGANEGERNHRMTSYVGWLINKMPGATVDEVLAQALVLNNGVRPPLPAREVESIVKSIYRRDQR